MRMTFSHRHSEFLPRIFREQQQQREQLQSASQHVKDHDQFRQVGKHGKVAGGAYQIQAGADVVQGRRDRRKAGRHSKIVKGNDENGNGENGDVGDEKNIGGTNHFMLHGLAVNLDLFDAAGV